MSIASEITRISGLRDTIRTKLVNLGIITDKTANLSACSTAINNLSKVTPSTPATTITITAAPTLNTSTGVITMSGSATASVKPTNSKGYTNGSATAGTITAKVSSSLQLSPTQAAQTITPGTSNKTIAAGRWLTGTQTIKGDSNLVAANIKNGVSIFGVKGTAAATINISTGTASSPKAIATFRSSLDGSSTISSNYITISVSDVSKVIGIATIYNLGDFTASMGIENYNGVRYLKMMKSSSRNKFLYIPLSSNSINIPVYGGNASNTSRKETYYVFTTE